MMIKPPSNIVELMYTLCDVLRARKFFDEAFFSDIIVKKLTSAQRVKIIRHKENPLLLEAEAFGFWVIDDDPQFHENEPFIRITLEIRPDGKKIVTIYGLINIDQPLLRYLNIDKIVIHIWPSLGEPEPQDGIPLYHRSTDSDGNIIIEYDYEGDGIREKATFTFNSDDLLRSFILRCEEI